MNTYLVEITVNAADEAGRLPDLLLKVEATCPVHAVAVARNTAWDRLNHRAHRLGYSVNVVGKVVPA